VQNRLSKDDRTKDYAKSMEDHTKDYTESLIDESLKKFIIGLKFDI
jgi:hypothetical protein